MWVLGVRVLGEDQAGNVQLQFQLPRGAAAGPVCSQRGSPSSPKMRTMTRMTRMEVVRLQGVVGVLEDAAG